MLGCRTADKDGGWTVVSHPPSTIQRLLLPPLPPGVGQEAGQARRQQRQRRRLGNGCGGIRRRGKVERQVGSIVGESGRVAERHPQDFADVGRRGGVRVRLERVGPGFIALRDGDRGGSADIASRPGGAVGPQFDIERSGYASRLRIDAHRERVTDVGKLVGGRAVGGQLLGYHAGVVRTGAP